MKCYYYHLRSNYLTLGFGIFSNSEKLWTWKYSFYSFISLFLLKINSSWINIFHWTCPGDGMFFMRNFCQNSRSVFNCKYSRQSKTKTSFNIKHVHYEFCSVPVCYEKQEHEYSVRKQSYKYWKKHTSGFSWITLSWKKFALVSHVVINEGFEPYAENIWANRISNTYDNDTDQKIPRNYWILT